jgi:SAM-dependent methyltransferase
MSDYKQRVERAILSEETFVRAVFSGQRPRYEVPWIKVVVRPVLIRGKRLLQVAYYDAVKCITKNYAQALAGEHVAQLLACGFKNIHVEATDGSLQVQFTKKGQALVHLGKGQGAAQAPDLAHDRQKHLVLPADKPDAFLYAVGIMTRAGTVRAERQRKFRQINEFLKLVEQTVDHATSVGALTADTFYVVDCGCGNAYLTFAAYHYFNDIRHVPTELVGVDVNAELLSGHGEKARELGWDKLTFHVGPIIDFEPARAPTIVLSLHACDTATDEALAQAIRWQSALIFSVPCCHHHLQRQLADRPAVAPFAPVMRQGVLGERLGDLLTDAFRALILRIMGYQTDVIEYVSSEHTAKNVMIRAVKRTKRGDGRAMREYRELKEFWGVTPYLEHLLQEELAGLLPRV